MTLRRGGADSSLARYLRAVRRAWASVLLFVVLGTALGVVTTLATKKVYDAGAEIAVASSMTEHGAGSAVAPLQSYAGIAVTPAVTGPVIAETRLGLSARELVAKISVITPVNQASLEVHVTDGDPLRAARLANAVAVQFDKVVRTGRFGAPAPQLEVRHPATVPGAPIEPRPFLNIGRGITLGLLAGLVFVTVQLWYRTLPRARAETRPGEPDARHRRAPARDHAEKRSDIQGLRAAAVAAVVLFHAGWTALPGGYVGVDVFFVISGFLITGNIDRRLKARDFSLLGFYANRARRLLPAAFFTIAVTCLGSYLILPPNQFRNIGRDALASAYYTLNWRMSAQSVDYLAQDQAPSPFQHFWSLAVEEQFYLLWPLLLMITCVLLRGAGRRLLAAAALVLVASFAYSVVYTSSHPSQAYFVTTTRMWELAVGGAVALLAGWWSRLPRIAAAAIGWLGVAGVGYSAVTFTGATYFPGSAAALPVLSAAAVIAAGAAAGSAGPVAVLGRAVPVFVGNISYSLYLWHWPIIVFAAAHVTGAMPLHVGLIAAAVSVVPAYLSYRFVETPGMRLPAFASTAAGLRLGLITTMSGAVAGMLLLVFIPQQNVSEVSVDATGVATDVRGHVVKVGAQVLGRAPRGKRPGIPRATQAGAPRDRFPSITPSPLTVAHDIPLDGRCSVQLPGSQDGTCVFGAKQSRIQVDLVGDSHAMQWQPALAAAAEARHWRVVTHTKVDCPFTTAAVLHDGRPYPSCTDWNKAVTRSIIAEHPRLVIATESHDPYLYRNGQPLYGADNFRAAVDGYRSAWRALTSAGIRIVTIAETPQPGYDIAGCISENLRHLSRCARARSDMIAAHTAEQAATRGAPDVSYVDLNNVVCPAPRCAAVIGGVIVYRDDNHLSATYVRTLAGYFGDRIAPYVLA